MAKLFVDILMQDAPPVGYIDIGFVEHIQLVDMDDVDFAIGKRFNALHRRLLIVERIHAERNVAFQREPRSSILSVVMEYGTGNALFNEINQAVCYPRLDDIGIFRIISQFHIRLKRLKRFIGYRIDFSDFLNNVFHFEIPYLIFDRPPDGHF